MTAVSCLFHARLILRISKNNLKRYEETFFLLLFFLLIAEQKARSRSFFHCRQIYLFSHENGVGLRWFIYS